MIPIFYACSILLFAMFGVTNVPAVVIFSFLYGFATGSGESSHSTRLQSHGPFGLTLFSEQPTHSYRRLWGFSHRPKMRRGELSPLLVLLAP